jgi:high-affinity iron transporter
MGELRGKMQSALGSGSRMGLFTIAFTAVFRESFECAIFLQGLSIDSSSGATWGAVAGLAAMIALVLFVKTVGFRLPMKTLFTASTVLLFFTAVVLLGQGVHSLQEVGVLPLARFPGPRVDVLGLFPDLYSLLPQLLLLLSPLPFWWWRRHQSGGSPRGPVPQTQG